MQLAQRIERRAVAPAAPRMAAARPLRVVAKAQREQRVPEVAKKAATASVALPAFLAAHPALALVNDRMNTEGAAVPFGINDGILAWVIIGTLSVIWAIFFVSQKDLGDFENPDDGLRIKDD